MAPIGTAVRPARRAELQRCSTAAAAVVLGRSKAVDGDPRLLCVVVGGMARLDEGQSASVMGSSGSIAPAGHG